APGGPVPIVAEILDKHGQVFVGDVVEQAVLQLEGVLVRTDQVGNQVFVGGTVIQNLNVLRCLIEELGVCSCSDRKKKKSREESRDLSPKAQAWSNQTVNVSAYCSWLGPLAALRLAAVPWAALRLAAVPWAALRLAAVPWAALRLAAVPWAALSSAAVPWAALRLAAVVAVSLFERA